MIYASTLEYLRLSQDDFKFEASPVCSRENPPHEEKRKEETALLFGCAAAKRFKCSGASCFLGDLRSVCVVS